MTFSIGHSVEGVGTPVVLLHSSMSSKAQWSRLVEQLKTRHQVIAIDLFGYGQTSFPKHHADFSLENEIRLVDVILSDVIGDSKPFHLIGHSYGGATSLRLALEQSARILSLSLFEPVAFYLLNREEDAYREIADVVEHIEAQITDNPAVAARSFVDYWNTEGAYSALPDKVQELLTQQILKVRLDFQALMSDTLNLSDFEELDIPVCLIAGEQSPISTRRIIDLLAETLPRNTRHEVSGGHMSPITHTNEVNPILCNFLQQV